MYRNSSPEIQNDMTLRKRYSQYNASMLQPMPDAANCISVQDVNAIDSNYNVCNTEWLSRRPDEWNDCPARKSSSRSITWSADAWDQRQYELGLCKVFISFSSVIFA